MLKQKDKQARMTQNLPHFTVILTKQGCLQPYLTESEERNKKESFFNVTAFLHVYV